MGIDDESATTLEDLRGDLAQRYKRTPTGGGSVDGAIVEADMAALDCDGYVIWENLLILQPAVTRSVLFGVLLIAVMTIRPQGLFGTAKVEIV